MPYAFHRRSSYPLPLFKGHTSRDLNLESVYQWARIKGLQVIATGDFTHPGWMAELEEKLESDGSGLFRLKPPPWIARR